jgi:hypothetical protein
MSLPKKEVPIWLSHEEHARLKQYAYTKRVDMKDVAASWVIHCLNQKIDEAMSLAQALVSSGLAKIDQDQSRGEVTNFSNSRFTDGLGGD